MTSGQEGIVITKIQIYTVNLQKFGVSETNFCPSPPVLQSSDQVPSFIIPQNKPASVLVHPLKGHQDWTTLSRVKGVSKWPRTLKHPVGRARFSERTSPSSLQLSMSTPSIGTETRYLPLPPQSCKWGCFGSRDVGNWELQIRKGRTISTNM